MWETATIVWEISISHEKILHLKHVPFPCHLIEIIFFAHEEGCAVKAPVILNLQIIAANDDEDIKIKVKFWLLSGFAISLLANDRWST